jgi:hypothetical protein
MSEREYPSINMSLHGSSKDEKSFPNPPPHIAERKETPLPALRLSVIREGALTSAFLVHSKQPEDNLSGPSPKSGDKNQAFGAFQKAAVGPTAQSKDSQQDWGPLTVSHSALDQNWISTRAPAERTYKNIIGVPSRELSANWIRRDNSRKPPIAISLTKIRGMLGIRSDGRHFLRNQATQEPYYTMGRGTYVTLSTALAFVTRYAPDDSLVPSILREVQESGLEERNIEVDRQKSCLG